MSVDVRKYWMVRLGRGGEYAQEMFEAAELGVDFVGSVDLTPYLSSTPGPFRDAVRPLAQARNPQQGKIGVGLAVGNLWVATCGISSGDVVLSLLGDGRYLVGEVAGPYRFAEGARAPHRRAVNWDAAPIHKADMGEELRLAIGGPMTVFNLDAYGAEIEMRRRGDALAELAGSKSMPGVQAEVEQLVAFQMEQQLEDFLVQNWASTTLGQEYDIYRDENGTGQQYQTDTGPMDILAISKDKRRLLVVELKRGRASDAAVGQVLRYMGWVNAELVEQDQTVEGLIIALQDDPRLKSALTMVNNVRFMTYTVRFELHSA